MTRLVKLLILAAGLVNVSIQQCTTESFETNAANRTETILQIQNVSITRIFYNCLSPSLATNSAYTSMYVSVFYISSNQSQNQSIRYNVKCESDQWSVVDFGTTDVVTGNVTRVDCASCLDQNINDDHCTRK